MALAGRDESPLTGLVRRPAARDWGKAPCHDLSPRPAIGHPGIGRNPPPMPELPEVEVLRSHLSRRLPGLRIASVQVLKPRITRPAHEADLARALVGATFDAVLRRGKNLVLQLHHPDGREAWMHVHLGMTGRIVLDDASRALPPHAAVVLGLGSSRCILVDPRQFGRWVLGQPEGLGPEPLDDAFGPLDLARALGDSNQPIKARLLDQSVVAGIGNIYANEALHVARLRPGHPTSGLRHDDVLRLHAAIQQVLSRAVALGSSLALDFENGSDGLFYFGASATGGAVEPEPWEVYDRAGQPCRRCGQLIRRFMMGGRSTFECRGCQR